MIYFSKSTNGFYDTNIASYTLPDDAIEITPEEHQSLLTEQSLGKQIQAGTDGKPEAVDRTVDASASIKAQAQSILDANDKTALRIWKAGGTWPSVWREYDEALREVIRGTATTLPTEPTTKPWEA